MTDEIVPKHVRFLRWVYVLISIWAAAPLIGWWFGTPLLMENSNDVAKSIGGALAVFSIGFLVVRLFYFRSWSEKLRHDRVLAAGLIMILLVSFGEKNNIDQYRLAVTSSAFDAELLAQTSPECVASANLGPEFAEFSDELCRLAMQYAMADKDITCVLRGSRLTGFSTRRAKRVCGLKTMPDADYTYSRVLEGWVSDIKSRGNPSPVEGIVMMIEAESVLVPAFSDHDYISDEEWQKLYRGEAIFAILVAFGLAATLFVLFDRQGMNAARQWLKRRL